MKNLRRGEENYLLDVKALRALNCLWVGFPYPVSLMISQRFLPNTKKFLKYELNK